MSTAKEYVPNPALFDQNHQDRLGLIARMDRLHELENQGILFGIRSRLIARKAAQISAREETYPMQAFDLATRLAALNPKLEKKAHTILEKKIAGKEDMPRPLEELTYLVLEKTVEKASDNEDDTITLPRLVITADHELMEKRISRYGQSETQQSIAEANEKQYAQAQQAVSNVVTLDTNKNVIPPEPGATGFYAPAHAGTPLDDGTRIHKVAS